MADDDKDPVVPLIEAAAKLGVTRQAIYQCLKGTDHLLPTSTPPGTRGRKIVWGCRMSVVETYRQHGYLYPKPRSPNGKGPNSRYAPVVPTA
jgi:hypothetical protein